MGIYFTTKTKESHEIFSPFRFNRALFADHFGKKIFEIWSRNNDARVKILINMLSLLATEAWDSQYLDCTIVISWSNFKTFFTKMISEEGSIKPKRRKNFMRTFCFSGELPMEVSNYVYKIRNFSYFYSPL